MSLDGNVGIITSEAALVLENAYYMSLEGNSGGYTLEATSGQMPKTSETTSSVEGGQRMEHFRGYFRANAHNIRSVEGSSGGKTPEDFSGHHMPIRLCERTATQQQVLGTSANAEFGHISMPEWARKPAELRSPGLFSQLSGVGP